MRCPPTDFHPPPFIEAREATAKDYAKLGLSVCRARTVYLCSFWFRGFHNGRWNVAPTNFAALARCERDDRTVPAVHSATRNQTKSVKGTVQALVVLWRTGRRPSIRHELIAASHMYASLLQEGNSKLNGGKRFALPLPDRSKLMLVNCLKT